MVDGYEVTTPEIVDIIEKLTEADGSAESKIDYLIGAVGILAGAIATLSEEFGAEANAGPENAEQRIEQLEEMAHLLNVGKTTAAQEIASKYLEVAP